MRRSRTLIGACAVGALALSGQLVPPAGAATPAAHHSPSPAKAGLGNWKQISTHAVGGVSQADLLPLDSGGVQLVWWEGTATTSALRTRVVRESGSFGSPVSTVIANWKSTIFDPQIIDNGSNRMVVFAGQHSTSASDPLNGPLLTATSANGTTWTLNQTQSMSEIDTADQSFGTGAVDDNGTPLAGVNAASGGAMLLHRGLTAGVPAASGDFFSSATACCSFDGALARDASTGAVWAAWYNNAASPKSENGVLAQQVYPSLGALKQVPGSSRNGQSNDPKQDVAMASRIGGGVYVAYKVGYKVGTDVNDQIAVWKAGTNDKIVFNAKNATHVMLAAGPHGRLWLGWYDPFKNLIHLSRSNPAATRFGPFQTVAMPSNKVGTLLNQITGSGETGPLHLVINGQLGSANPQFYYQKVLPSLTLVATPRSLDKGIVMAKVTDAGDAVGGAKVTFGGSTKTTNVNGVATFKVSKHFPSGKVVLKATKSGYAAGTASVKVT